MKIISIFWLSTITVILSAETNFYKKEIQKIESYIFLKNKSKLEIEKERKKNIADTSYRIKNKNIVFMNNSFYQDIKSEKMTWIEAYDYCNNLNLYASSNWYLPTKNEYENLFVVKFLDSTSGFHYELNKLFKNINTSKDNKYWSSTTYKKDGLNSSALTVKMDLRNYEVWDKSKKFKILCATKDNVVTLNDKIITYSDEIIKYKKTMKSNSEINIYNTNKPLSKLELKIKKCKDKSRGWKFDSNNEVTCTGFNKLLID